MELSMKRGLKWSEIGRELGRSAIQCHTWYMSRDPKVTLLFYSCNCILNYMYSPIWSRDAQDGLTHPQHNPTTAIMP